MKEAKGVWNINVKGVGGAYLGTDLCALTVQMDELGGSLRENLRVHAGEVWGDGPTSTRPNPGSAPHISTRKLQQYLGI